MKQNIKCLTITLILFFTALLVLAQNPNIQLLQTIPAVDYSESKPYQPRQFPKDKKTKREKEKKSEQNNRTSNETPDVAVLPLRGNQTITIPVSVFNSKGDFVTTLKQPDFKIFADDKEQEILSVSKQNDLINVILMIDTSPSTAYKIDQIQNYALSIIERLPKEDKVMIIEFNEQTKVLSELTSDRQVAAKAIAKINFGEGTSLYEAVKNTFDERVNTIKGQTIVLLLTDGVDTTSRKTTYANSLLAVEKTNASVFPIYFDTYSYMNSTAKGIALPLGILLGYPSGAVTSGKPISTAKGFGSTDAEYEIGKMYLDDISLLSGGRPWIVKDITDTRTNNVNNFDEEIRAQYQVTFRPSDFIAGQRKQIRVRINHPNLYVQARGSLIVDGN